ncbi:MAG: DUF2807 domain-containing protein [Clostridia bacterium]|nr:DUF2807 domain-containing protein [Clostridia bacterium]
MYRMEEFATVVAKQRKKLKMTQEELAARLNITPQAVSKWENGIGYPDVTLFPLLAEILRIPIESLFGRSPKTAVPQNYRGLPLVAERAGNVCYSDKPTTAIGEKEITFSDGSVADLAEGVVYNRGKGEIRIFHLDEITNDEETFEVGIDTDFCEEISDYDTLDISISQACNISVLPANEQVPCVTAHGSAKFISALEVSRDGNTLFLRFKKSNPIGGNNTVHLYTPFERGNELKCNISGCGSADIAVDFLHGELSVSGCGSIQATSFGKATVRISGSGSITTADIAGDADVRVSGSGDICVGDIGGKFALNLAGSGDIVAKHVGATDAKISGSGDIQLKSVKDSFTAQISGSGEIACTEACEIDSLSLNINGSGALSANNMTVGDAEIRATGSADVTLARIKGTSVEKLSKESRLIVRERG